MGRLRIRMASGQSIVFMGVMILILIAFTGLTIDTGRAFQRQRTIQAASNASSIAGMNRVLLNSSDAQVLQEIQTKLTENGSANFQRVVIGNGWGTDRDVVYFTAEYLDANGVYINDVGSLGNTIPNANGVFFVRVTTSENVETTFASAFGQKEFTVNADGAAGKGNCTIGVYPITYPQHLSDNRDSLTPVEAFNDSAATLLSRYTTLSGGTRVVNTPRAPVFVVDRSSQTGSFYWTRWNGNESNGSANGLENSLAGTGNLNMGFAEADPPSTDPAAQALVNGRLEIGDWLATDTGNTASVQDVIQPHVTNKTMLIIPAHDLIDSPQGQNRKYRVSQFIKIRVLEVIWQGNTKRMTFGIVSPNAMCARAVPPNFPPDTTEYPAKITISEELRYYDESVVPTSFDIAIVQDYSASMRFGWSDETERPVGQRRIDYARPVLEAFIEEMLVTRNDAGAENRVAMVTYGHKQGSQMVAKVRVPFMDNRDQALAAYNQLLGSPVPNTELDYGGTPTADGLAKAITLLNNARSVDSQGRPVQLVVLLLTDGLANVLFDGSFYGKANTHTLPPYRCGDSSADTSNPLVQSSCPRGPAFGEPRSPIQAAIDIANDARARDDVTFYAVVLGEQFGLTPQDLRMNLIAPNRYFMANSPAHLSALIEAIGQIMNRTCQVAIDPIRPASGATVFVRHQDGTLVDTYTTNQQGVVIANLAPGTSYKVEAQHMNIISPNDPAGIPRNYNRLRTAGMTEAADFIAFEMPSQSYTVTPATLVIDDEANAACPEE